MSSITTTDPKNKDSAYFRRIAIVVLALIVIECISLIQSDLVVSTQEMNPMTTPSFAVEENSRNVTLIPGIEDDSPLAQHNESSSSQVISPATKILNDTLPPLGTAEYPIAIITYLSGELGNNLGKLATGYGLKWWLQDDFGIHSRVILQHQDVDKWVRARDSINLCFPNLRHSNFEEANNDEMNKVDQLQLEWLGESHHNSLRSSTAMRPQTASNVRMLITALTKALRKPNRPAINPEYNFTVPFVKADSFAGLGIITSRYSKRFREELMAFDFETPQCCKERAAFNESVFHLRNFLVEMPLLGAKLGFSELSPNKTAKELFQHLIPGSSVAITSRFTDSRSNPYLEAFHARGIHARIIQGQSLEQDFCFLLSAQQEFVGISMSSFATWAAYLGNASSVRLYTLNKQQLPQKGGSSKSDNETIVSQLHNFSFPNFYSENWDEIEAQKENPKLVSLPSKKSMNRKGKTQNGMNTHNKSTLINHVKKKA